MSKSQKYFYDAEAVSEKSTWFESDHRAKDGPTVSKRMGMDGADYQCKRQGVYNSSGNRNKRTVWTVTTKPYKEAHFATFPPDLIIPCIKAGSRQGDIVLDPFGGSLTTAYVAKELGRKAIMIELNEKYIDMGLPRLAQEVLPF